MNPPHNQIRIPTITPKHQHQHLVFVKVWFVQYYVGDKIKRKSTKTIHFDEAVIFRDNFFDSLRKAGANTSKPKTPKEKISLDNKKYISVRPAYGVKVGKKHLGYFKTRKMAEEVRDKYVETIK